MNDKQIIYQGAEAKILLSKFLSKTVIKKHRINKTYRIKEIDEVLISNRTKEEAKLIHLARKQGVCVPSLFDVDLTNGAITMSYIKGDRIKDIFDTLDNKKRKDLCIMIGENIARLHNNNIIHGDITTSNMILSDNKVFFIDFGLGEINHELESKGVDLHVLMEAMESTHSKNANDFKYVLLGYEKEYNDDIKHIKKKIDDIVKRGRYR